MLSDHNIQELVHNSIDLPGNPANHRVVVAMSGGVDSSVAAGLVKMAGYETIGITLQLYDHGAAIAKKGACCAGQDIHDARLAADKLGIAHYVLDYESAFHDQVIVEFVDSYLSGETPVPCITCNQTVKFADLLAQAKQLGASAMVTGHYVENVRRGGANTHFDMLTPLDMDRDQSYFLYATTTEQLDFLRFPLARLTKPQTRQLAAEMGLTIADKPDSQDICFVPEGDYTKVITDLRPDAGQAGDIVHIDGRTLGQHDGIINYTIGQRRGLGISDNDPLYVTSLDPATTTVYVGPRQSLAKDKICLRNINWLDDQPLEHSGNGRKVFVKLRSTRPAQPATLKIADGQVCVLLDEVDFGISPGQACVIYEHAGSGAKILGGGVIADAIKT